MNIEVLLMEAEIANEFAESLEARDLPEKYFYWLPMSAKAWQELSAQHSYRELDRCWELVNGKAAELTAHFGQTVPVVSLGAGNGTKDRALINALQRAGKLVKYFPVDASQTLLEGACAAAEDDDVEVLGIKADISSPMHVVLAFDAAESPKVILMAGNTLGGFDPLDQIRNIAETLKSGDRFVLDAELFRADPPEEVHTKLIQFTMAPLASLGIQEDDGQIRFETKQDERHAGLYVTTKYFQAHRDLRMTVTGQEVSVARGERVLMNFSYSFSPEAFRWLLKDHAKLKIEMEFVSSEAKFILAVCSC
jgi:uncharacterized SAM-dependent methyltransferase